MKILVIQLIDDVFNCFFFLKCFSQRIVAKQSFVRREPNRVLPNLASTDRQFQMFSGSPLLHRQQHQQQHQQHQKQQQHQQRQQTMTIST